MGKGMEIIEFLKEYVKNLAPNECYILCILSRKKNNPGMVDSKQIMKRRIITPDSDIQQLYEELLAEAAILSQYDFYMYITCNPRSIKKSLELYITELIKIYGTFESDVTQLRRIPKITHNWYSILQRPQTRGVGQKYFLIDLDVKSRHNEVVALLTQHNAEIVCIRTTRNGYHFVVKPFDISKFPFEFPSLMCKKDGLLFVEDLKHEN